MDVFVEQLVRKKRTPLDFVKVFLCLIAATFIITFMFFIAVGATILNTIVFFAAAGLVYILFRVGTSINIEYEYIFTNGVLDADKIINRRSRKPLASFNAREIEVMATVKNSSFKTYMNNNSIKKIYACSSVSADNTYFVVYKNGEDLQMLFFNPNDTIKGWISRLSPQKVYLDN